MDPQEELKQCKENLKNLQEECDALHKTIHDIEEWRDIESRTITRNEQGQVVEVIIRKRGNNG